MVCDGGFYRNFVSETIDGFEQAGARLYNEAILATPVGTAAMRVTKQFESGRKLAKTHQNVPGVLQRRLEEGCGALRCWYLRCLTATSPARSR